MIVKLRSLQHKSSDSEYAYVSGKVSGEPNYNREAFYCIAEQLQKSGWRHVLNPLEQDAALHLKTSDCVFGSGSTARNVVLFHDCKYICLKKPKLYVLPGWRKSTGAVAEVSLAKALSLPITYLRKETVDIICQQHKHRCLTKIFPDGLPETKQEEIVQ